MSEIIARAQNVFGESLQDTLIGCAAASEFQWLRSRDRLFRWPGPRTPTVSMSGAQALSYYGFYVCERAIRDDGVLVLTNKIAAMNAIQRRRAMMGVEPRDFLDECGISHKDWQNLKMGGAWGDVTAKELSRACSLLGLDFHKVGVFVP